MTDQFKLSDLASLTNLKVVTFLRCCYPDMRMLDQPAALAHKLGKDRPNVAFRTTRTSI